MTVVPGRYVPGPRTSSTVTAEDVEAAQRIADYRAGQLLRLQSRSEKWIGGLTATAGILTTAVVVKGPEDFSKLSDGDQQAIVWLLSIGGVLLAIGVLLAYSAAHGNPFDSGTLEDFADRGRPRVTGASQAWRTAVSSAISSSKKYLQLAAVATVVAVLFLGGAIVKTWTSPEEDAEAGTGVCIETPDGIAKVSAAPAVKTGSITIVPCP